MPQALPSGEDVVQEAPGVAHDEGGKEEGSVAVDISPTQKGTDRTTLEEGLDLGPPEAGDAANGVDVTDDQAAKPELAILG